MIMPADSGDDRLALVLAMLGPDVAETVIDNLPERKRERLRTKIKDKQDLPVNHSELSETVDEFMRFFNFAKEHLESPVSQDDEAETEFVPDEPDRKSSFVSSGDPFVDLRRLKPTQIAGALQNESPRTIAVVMNCLDVRVAGEALKHLTDEMRGAVFVQLRNPQIAQQNLVERIVRTTVDKGCKLDAERVSDPEEEVNQKLADLLRHVDQQQRSDMLSALAEQDEELATNVKGMLYLFEDLADVSDRSMQKLLGQVESSVLCRSLKDADDAIVENVMNNLSKRAKASLAEELEFLANIKPAEVEEARAGVTAAMAKLDESGDLEMK